MPVVVGAVEQAQGNSRSWLVYLLASLGKTKAKDYVQANAAHLLPELDFFWKYHEDNWTNRLEIANQVDFLSAQHLPT